ncbi:hypothetical protein BJS_05791 [Bradyrhizobium japonicum SEMIA 5079]|nr:hypothetical protein BJS_05791 [Bradyrhizobium japonicum SEMIA 5079]KGJ64446.1 hypothetical protein BJA5080_07145 [Bradyrhizobium diazoefficiens SEMIA 5080]
MVASLRGLRRTDWDDEMLRLELNDLLEGGFEPLDDLHEAVQALLDHPRRRRRRLRRPAARRADPSDQVCIVAVEMVEVESTSASSPPETSASRHRKLWQYSENGTIPGTDDT